jgi:chaperonin GroES
VATARRHGHSRARRAWEDSKELTMAKTRAKTAKASGARKAPTIRPLGEKVLVKRLEAEETTRGGIVLPDTAKEKPQKGTVLALGDGKLLDDGTRAAFQVHKGDTVLFASYGGTEIKVEGEDYLLMDESDVLAILD